MAIAAVVLTGVAQLLLKRGAAARGGRHIARLWVNPSTLTGYAIMGSVTVMSLYAFKVVPLRAYVFLSPIPLFLVTVLSVAFFGERLTRVQLAGCALIVIGIAVFNL